MAMPNVSCRESQAGPDGRVSEGPGHMELAGRRQNKRKGGESPRFRGLPWAP